MSSSSDLRETGSEAMDVDEASDEMEMSVKSPKAKGKHRASDNADLRTGQTLAERAKATLPWVEKYRPSDLTELISQDDIVSTLNRLIGAHKLPHLLFYGPAGTGKTSTIHALAKKLYGNSYNSMVLELNASDDRGINVVRNQCKEFAGTRKLLSSGVKLVILDEADAMTADAQFSLRRIIEKYTKNTRFCLICNYVSKIIPALQSRCTRFRFSPLKSEQVRGRVGDIIKHERLDVTEDGFDALLRVGNGDMRRILNVLQATAMAYDVINEEHVYLCTGNPQPQDIQTATQKILNETFEDNFEYFSRLMRQKGYALQDLVEEIFKKIKVMQLPPKVYCYILKELSDLEYRLAFATSESLQLGSLIGIFVIARDMLKAHAP